MGQTALLSSSRQAVRLVCITGIAVIAAVAVFWAVAIRTEYESQRAKASIRAHTSAHVVATQFHWIIEASSQSLQRIEDAIRLHESGMTDDPVRDLNDAVRDLPDGYQYSVYDAAGNLTYSNIVTTTGINVVDRDYFQKMQEGDKIVVSPMLRERLTGEDVFIIARRIERDGQMVGAATIAIPASALQSLASAMSFTGQSAISLIRLDGTLIVRTPKLPTMDLSNARVFQEMKTARDGVYENRVSPADGVSRFVGYWQMEDWPVVAVAGLDRDLAMADFRRNLSIWSALALPAIIALSIVFIKLLKMMQADSRRQAALIEANQRNEFLLREIHHRVKNNLQTVMSLIRLQIKDRQTANSLLGRIGTMVAIHEKIYATDQFATIDASGYLRELTESIAQSQSKATTLHFDLDPVDLSSDRAMSIGLLANEIISNAFKHAWDTDQIGNLWVSLKKDGDDMLVLTIADDGKGIDPHAAQNMGSRLMAAFASQLDGNHEIVSENGTRIIVRFPLKCKTAPDDR